MEPAAQTRSADSIRSSAFVARHRTETRLINRKACRYHRLMRKRRSYLVIELIRLKEARSPFVRRYRWKFRTCTETRVCPLRETCIKESRIRVLGALCLVARVLYFCIARVFSITRFLNIVFIRKKFCPALILTLLFVERRHETSRTTRITFKYTCEHTQQKKIYIYPLTLLYVK